MLIKHKTPYKSLHTKANRSKKLDEGFEYGGNVYQVDRDSLAAIDREASTLARKLQLNTVSKPTEWRTLDNQMITFEPMAFIAFANDAVDYVKSVYIEGWK